MQDTLVLDQSNRPIGFVSWQRAVKLYWEDCVEIVREDQNGKVLRSPSLEMGLPRVVRVKGYVAKRLRKNLFPTRYNVAIRDDNTCQYCGEVLAVCDQTLDHVVPRSRGGKDAWENLVLACKRCNSYKDDQTPDEAGMQLIRKPFEPKVGLTYQSNRRVRPEWVDWIDKGMLY
jgi:5-methylcytosine-specific restriction endonuclease McrA